MVGTTGGGGGGGGGGGIELEFPTTTWIFEAVGTAGGGLGGLCWGGGTVCFMGCDGGTVAVFTCVVFDWGWGAVGGGGGGGGVGVGCDWLAELLFVVLGTWLLLLFAFWLILFASIFVWLL